MILMRFFVDPPFRQFLVAQALLPVRFSKSMLSRVLCASSLQNHTARSGCATCKLYAEALSLPLRSPSIFCEIISVSVFLETLPNGDNGKSCMISKRSGSLYLAISLPIRKVFNSSKVRRAFSRSKTHAHMRSPRTGSGTGTQDAFFTER